MGQATQGCALCWLRNDLRLQDNPALAYALRHHRRVLCVYIDADSDKADPSAGDWWRYRALQDLAEQLDGRLLYCQGEVDSVFRQLLNDFPVAAVYWNRAYDPVARERDTALKQWLRSQSLSVVSFPGNLLFEPWEVVKPDGTPYRVFTPFYKAALVRGFAAPVAEADLSGALVEVEFDAQCGTRKALRDSWTSHIAAHWQPTRAAGLAQLGRFLDGPIADYAERRNLPASGGASCLSPYLHFGQLGVREVVARAAGQPGAEDFIRELLWREFGHAVLYHWPETLAEPMDRRFEAMPWREAEDDLQAWQRGQTGVPLVDAGMRELWQTGFMHNRVRMVVASYLTKHLMIDWRQGARWFEYTLVDADPANNTLGWQWTAGSGVDAAPYFRIFNPVAQAKRFDPDGAYVRRWVPELARLPDRWLNEPWAAPAEVLQGASVRLGGNYPTGLVELGLGRRRALSAWERIKGGN
jgi:deoxyribodipyrimidine photo-lyase